MRQRTVSPPHVRAVPARRRYRRRYYGRRRYSGKWIVELPIGIRVYVAIQRAEPEPDRLRRKKWGWCEVISTKPRSPSVVLRPDGEGSGDVRADSRSCFIRASSGRWMELRTARDRKHPTLWWWHDVAVLSFRPATELEVAFYADGIVPHAQWRLMDGSGNTFVELPKPERVWLAKPEPPTDEEMIEAKEKTRTKKRTSELEHARRMLAVWERESNRATKRRNVWKTAVKRLEKPLATRKRREDT